MNASAPKTFAAGFLAGAVVAGALGFVLFSGGGAEDPEPQQVAEPGQPVITPAPPATEAVSEAKLRGTLDVACRAVTAGYPFATPSSGAAAGAETSAVAFGNLFGPEGHFATYTAAFGADAAPGGPVAVALAEAADIRALFEWDPGQRTRLPLRITPFALSRSIERAELAFGDQTVVTRQSGNHPAEVNWTIGDPVSVRFEPELPGRKSAEQLAGNWALFRFVEKHGDGLVEGDTRVRLALSERMITYRFRASKTDVTAAINKMRGFQCPEWPSGGN